MSTVWMCSGQGSQYYQMGRACHDGVPEFRRAMARCDEILRPLLGLRLSEVIYAVRADPHAPFDQLRHSSPAIVSVQYATGFALRARGHAPDCVLGYSLGEISAAILCGAYTLEEGLRLSVQMAELLEREAPRGAMLAVLGPATLLVRHPHWFAGVHLAGRNFDGHFVLSGETGAIERTEAALQAAQVSVQRLPVRYPFHSPLMAALGPQLRALADAIPSAHAALDMVSATDASVSRRLGGARLWHTLSEPVDFASTLAALAARGMRRCVDLGPSGTLATFAKYALPKQAGIEIVSTITPFGATLGAFAPAAAR